MVLLLQNLKKIGQAVLSITTLIFNAPDEEGR